MSQITQSMLRISGPPGVKFRIVPRTRGDEIVDDVATGKLDATGSAQLTLPKGYYVMIAEGHSTIPVHVVGDAEVLSVELLPEG